MEIRKGLKISGFTVTNIRPEKEIDGTLVEMIHDESGAGLVWIDNGDENKLFSITFKTLPSDSTGVFHILEHSVLNGSDKYPVKEPFVDLLKSSMNTYLNAMTFQDKTMYPVSSRNEKDFLNLTSVYLDAVFAPAILKNPNIFYQEGWHIEADEDGTLSFKGVVFNEMKGALADPDDLINEEFIKLLYPDNCYGVNSGGDPEIIPTLTFENFIETYKTFYHPSNARIFLDGAVPLEKVLAMLDSYLSGRGKLEVLPSFELQVPTAREDECEFAVTEDEGTEGKGRLAAGKIFAGENELLKSFAAGMIFNSICDSNDSPLKKAVLDSGLAEDISADVVDDIPQPYYMILAKNVQDGKDAELWALIRETCRKLCEEGIDRKALAASINSGEFAFKSPREPAGLLRCIKSMVTWLHDGDPMELLAVDGLFKELREKLDGSYYEDLLKELVLDEDGLCLLHAKASLTAASDKDDAEAKWLSDIESYWTEEEVKLNAELNEALALWQETPDSEEARAMLPTLPISEVSPEPQWDDTIVKEDLGVTVLYHKVPSRGIINLRLYFNLSDRSLEEITRIATLTSLLGELRTANHSGEDLVQDIKTYIGALSFKVSSFARIGCTDRATPCLVVSASVLKENLAIAEDLIAEILLTTDFSDYEKIKSIIKRLDISSRQSVIGMGHSFSMYTAMAGYTASAAVADAATGYSSIMWLHKMAEEFDGRVEGYTALLKDALEKAVVKKRLTASVTASDYEPLTHLLEMLPKGSSAPSDRAYATQLPARMGCRIPAQVGYSAQAYHLSELGEKFDGSLLVASNMFSYDFLWNKVRVQGGAYGTGFRADSTGFVSTYSYRDPTPCKSVGINLELGDYLRQVCKDKAPLNNFIIAAAASTEPLASPAQRGLIADKMWFTGFAKEDVRNIRKQLLATDYEKLEWCATIADKMAENGRIAAMASEEKLEEFDNIEILDI